jgi:hypothetical protein
MKKIKLHHLSSQLESEFLNYAETMEMTPRHVEITKNIKKLNPGCNIVQSIYFIYPELFDKIHSEYEIYFPNTKFTIQGTVLKNIDPTRPAVLPPHSDMSRLSTIQFALDPGGEQTRTTFYKNSGDYTSISKGGSKSYDDPELIFDASYALNDKMWYGLDTKKYHSVENISTTRILVSIAFLEMTYFDFIEQYSHLIIS